MTGALPPGARPPGTPGGVPQHPGSLHETREPWPRDFGRDGISGLITLDRAMRARDVSRPGPDDEQVAGEVIDELLARIDGRRTPSRT